MKRVYIGVSNPDNTEKTVRAKTWQGPGSILIKKFKYRLSDPLLVPVPEEVANKRLDSIFEDIRRTNAYGQMNN